MEKLNNIKVEFIEDGSIHTLGYTVPSGDMQGVAQDLMTEANLGDGTKDFDDVILPPSGLSEKELNAWENGDVLDIMHDHGVKMHRAFYEDLQGYYTAVQASGFSDDVAEHYWDR